MDLTLAAWRATMKLLSPNGEALLRMHVTEFNGIMKMKEPGFDKVWYVDLKETDAHVYLHNRYTTKNFPCIRATRPGVHDRQGRIPAAGWESYTKGQRDIFLKTLKK